MYPNPFALKRDNLAWRRFWRMISGETCIIDWNDHTHAPGGKYSVVRMDGKRSAGSLEVRSK